MGLLGLATFAVPPLMLGLTIRQYLDRTRASVEEVRTVNEELKESNDRAHRTYLSTIAALSRSIEAKDDYSGGHVERVRVLSVEIAKRLGYEGRELEAIEVGALLHDIGKIGVPESILNKPGPLSDEEWAEMKKHPVISDYILAGVELHPYRPPDHPLQPRTNRRAGVPGRSRRERRAGAGPDRARRRRIRCARDRSALPHRAVDPGGAEGAPHPRGDAVLPDRRRRARVALERAPGTAQRQVAPPARGRA